MSKMSTITVTTIPLILTVCLYGTSLARISSNSIWFLWLQAGFFVMLCLFVLLVVISLIPAWQSRRFLIPGLLLGFVALGGSFPINQFVITKQDEQFLRKLVRYQQAADWIEQHGGAKPAEDQFADLAREIFVQKSPIFGFEVFFVAYPGPFGARLHGYAYTSADQWNDTFVRVYGTPKKLTNNWFRI